MRSTLIPGWGQLYCGKRVRGTLSCATGLGSAGYLVYAAVTAHNARVERDDWRNYMDSKEFQNSDMTWDEGMDTYSRLDRQYNDRFSRMTLSAAVCAGLSVLNMVDAAIAGKELNRDFELYFSAIQGPHIDANIVIHF